MNNHQLAVRITKLEEGKVQVSVAQAKEILKLVGIEIANDFKIAKNLERSGKRYIKKYGYQSEMKL